MTPQLRRNLSYGGVAIAVLIVAGLGALVYRTQRPDQPREVAIPADLINPPRAATAKPGTAPAKEAAPADAPGAMAPPAAGQVAAGKPEHGNNGAAHAKSMSEPRFDVVRVERNGESVVAGRAAPNTTVKLLANGKVAGSAKTDSTGQFVMIPEALKPGDHQLTLRAVGSGGHEEDSKQAVVVSVPKTPADKLLVVTEEPGKPANILSAGAAAAPPSAAAKETAAAAAPAPAVSTKAPAPAAPAVSAPAAAAMPPQTALASLPPPSRNLPAAPSATPATSGGSGTPPAAAMAAPHIDAVEAEAGHLFVQGRGEPGAQLRIYLNNTPVAGAAVGPDGKWTLTIRHGLTPGRYEVRVDQLGKDGTVTARAAAPFDYQPKLAAAEAPPAAAPPPVPSVPAAGAAATAAPSPAAGATPAEPVPPSAAAPEHEAGPPPAETAAAPQSPATAAASASAAVPTANPVVEQIGTVVIVRGDNLWTISRNIYGHGIRYTVIYAANQSQISDPNLIYPGQVFVVPPASQAPPGVAKTTSSG
jgi:nucleoid-associated protein YgaU